MINQLKSIEKSMADKPSVDSMSEMIRLIEHTFKRQLGENVVGLKVTVGQVIKAIQNKASKEEVMRLVAARFSAMQESMELSQENEFNIAGSVRCISCGNAYAPCSTHGSSFGTLSGKTRPSTTASILNKSPIPTANSINTQSSGTFTRGVLTSGYSRDSSLSAEDTIDIEGTHDTSMTYGSLNDYNNDLSLRRGQTPSESSFTMPLSSSSHLKPLFNQEKPSEPINNPLAKNLQVTRPRRGLAIAQEPLYRKARMASTLKELVKPTSTSTYSSINLRNNGGTPGATMLSSNTMPLVVSEKSMTDESARGGGRDEDNNNGSAYF